MRTYLCFLKDAQICACNTHYFVPMRRSTAMPTQRDRIWRASIDLAGEYRRFEVQDVLYRLDSDPSRKTVQRTLRAMTELDVLRHRRGSPKYSAGDVLRGLGGSGNGEPSRLRRVVVDEGEPELEATGADVQEDPADVTGDDDRRDWLADVEEPPASTREEFEEAAAAVAELAEERGEVTRQDAQDALHDDVPAGYGNARTWWRKVARPVLTADPEVKAPVTGASKWRFVGDLEK